jgi:hypothetical protein
MSTPNALADSSSFQASLSDGGGTLFFLAADCDRYPISFWALS